MTDAAAMAKDLAATGVAGLQISWADNNGIPRSRVVPIDSLSEVSERGVGVTSLFAVFDSLDGITFDHEGLANASGDVRLLPVLERVRWLAGQPALAWAPGRQVAADGSPWPYDQRGVLERQVESAAGAGLELRAGWEIEFVLSKADAIGVTSSPGHHGPAYSPHALLEVDDFVAALLRDAAASGLRINQLHAEYGPAQVELSLAATDPISAADDQLLARQVIHAAARANGLRASFAPLVTPDGIGNGWLLHTSV
ncbi:MAG: glutamine synthetase, partial [Sciscionella sp.]